MKCQDGPLEMQMLTALSTITKWWSQLGKYCWELQALVSHKGGGKKTRLFDLVYLEVESIIWIVSNGPKCFGALRALLWTHLLLRNLQWTRLHKSFSLCSIIPGTNETLVSVILKHLFCWANSWKNKFFCYWSTAEISIKSAHKLC